MIDDRFDIVGAFPDSKLPIRARTFMQNSLDVVHLAPASELGYFVSNKLDEFVNQTACFRFLLPTEVNELAVNPIARGAPAIFIEQTPSVNPERDVLPKQFVQF